jgi:hypothetical protein
MVMACDSETTCQTAVSQYRTPRYVVTQMRKPSSLRLFQFFSLIVAPQKDVSIDVLNGYETNSGKQEINECQNIYAVLLV